MWPVRLYSIFPHFVYKAESLFVCLFVCLFVYTLHKLTFLNQTEPMFTHISPLVWKRPYGMHAPKIFDLLYLFDLFRWERVPNPRREMAAGASYPRQRYIRDSCCCLCDVTEMTFRRRQFRVLQEAFATGLYP